MKRLTAFVAVMIAAVIALSTPALGGTSESFFEVDPTSAPPGGTVTVNGFCEDDINEWEAVFFYLDIPDASEEFLDLGNFPITPGVPWTFEITIPAEATPGETTIGKQCARVDDEGNFDGGEATQRQDFVVLEPIDTTDTTETTATTTPPSEAAAAATAPATQPRFTG